MKLNLFLNVLVLFTVHHLSKASPLRLQKRAAFYIANETACVVDNIVYSNGDPIPTDDPCEACKCRPPGFACVLKECRVKPGCKAVRHIGQCCPEYVCGCEHNGKMYRDGEEIRDSSNPCYECHCQGSSIACAFVDCFFRDDCEAVFAPGKCCPEYKNCSRDIPEDNGDKALPPILDNPENNGDKALPPVNLLPSLNDESVLPGDLPSPSSANPTSPSTSSVSNEEIFESKESTELNKPQTTESVISTTDDSKSVPAVEERNSEVEKTSTEEKREDQLESSDKNEPKVGNEETKELFNSETEIKKEDSTEEEEATQSSIEKVTEENSQATAASQIMEAEVTEKSLDESKSTEISENEKVVKNSAAENSKSLKISDGSSENSEEKEITQDESKEAIEKLETETESKAELSKESSEETSTTENKPESVENIPEESQTNPQATSFYSNEKIKSESAETATIVIHVREKTTTEKDSSEEVTSEVIISKEVTPESVTSETQENLLKSNELKNPEVSEASTEANVGSTGKNFEIFPGSTEISKDESLPTTKPESEARSDEIDPTTSNVEQTKESVTEIKKDEELLVTSSTQSTNDVTEVSKEARANEEIVEEIKTDESKKNITVITIKPSAPIKIEIITDRVKPPKSEEQTTQELENNETTEETKIGETPSKLEEKIEESNSEATAEEAKPEERGNDSKLENAEEILAKSQELSGIVKESISTEKIEASEEKVGTSISEEKEGTPVSEEKEGTPVSEEKVGTPDSEEKVGTPILEEKEASPISAEIEASPISAEKETSPISEESIPKTVNAEERIQEIESENNAEILETEKSAPGETTKISNQEIEVSKQTEALSTK